MVTCKIDGEFSHAVICAADSLLLPSLTMFKTADELISAVVVLWTCGSFEIGTVGVCVALVPCRREAGFVGWGRTS